MNCVGGKITALLAALLLWLNAAAVPGLAEGYAGMRIAVTTDNGSGAVTLEVWISGIEAFGGQLGLKYDQNILELMQVNQDTGELESAEAAPDIRTVMQMVSKLKVMPSSALPLNEMVSAEKGYVLGMWTTNPVTATIDARTEPQKLFTISFRLREGRSSADYDETTFQFERAVSSNIGGWTYPAKVIEKNPPYNIVHYAGYVPQEGDMDMETLNVAFDYENNDVTVPGVTGTVRYIPSLEMPDPGARVVFTSQADGTGYQAKLVPDPSGTFAAYEGKLRPGVYDLKAEKAGHLSHTLTGIIMGTDPLSLADITLTAGDINGDGWITFLDAVAVSRGTRMMEDDINWISVGFGKQAQTKSWTAAP